MTMNNNADNDKITSLSRLMHASHELARSTDLDELLNKAMLSVIDVTDSEMGSFLLVDEDTNELYFRKATGTYGELLQTIRLPITDSSVAGWCAVHREVLIVNDAMSDPRHYKGVDQVTSITTRSLLCVPVLWGDRLFGVLEAINRKSGQYSQTDAEHLSMLATQVAVALNNVRVVDQLQNFFAHMVDVIITALEVIDPSNRGHVVRVARLSTLMARELGLPTKQIEQVLYAAYFHDIGRLFNESAHTGARDHNDVARGAQLLEQIKLLEKVAPLVRHHLERYDGSGKPGRLRGEEIPLGARIIGLAVDYDEAYARSVGHLPLHVFQAQFLDQAAERHDPRLVETLARHIAQSAPPEARATPADAVTSEHTPEHP